MLPAGRHCLAALLSFAATATAQPLTRVAASSLKFSGDPPATTYATTRAFPGLSFNQPVALVTPRGDSRRLFVVEKTGRIYVIPDVTAQSPTRTLFLDLSSQIEVSNGATDERGLLALAFHPEYTTNGHFYVWYTTLTTTAAGTGLHDRLARFRVSSMDPNVANRDSEEPLITQRDEANNHNGGELLFGPDGYLYVSIGDEGGGDDQFQNGQRIDRDFFAGILRLDVDRRPGSLPPNPHPAVHAGTYAVPPDNPFVGATSFNGNAVDPATVRTEFWAVGLRNPWRMAFDAETGRLWCADVGQSAREEINIIVRGGNYGWPYREGGVPGPRADGPAASAFTEPVWDYPRAAGQAITGGYVYRGTRLAGLLGQYLFADFVTGRIWALRPDGDRPVESDRIQLLTMDGGISSFGRDPGNGDVLLADLTEGSVKRLVAAADGTTTHPATLSATGIFTNVAALEVTPGVVEYRPNVPAWNDHASVRRWFALPAATGAFGFSPHGAWTLPAGAVWVQHFNLALERGNVASERRVETRVLVKTVADVYGLTYRWNEAQTDATLVAAEGADTILTVSENGRPRFQTWRLPARAECNSCHTAAGGFALSFNSRQLNRDHEFAGGRANIIEALGSAGYLDSMPPPAATLPALPPIDGSRPTELRARAYLDANCSHCHQPGGVAPGTWDARAVIPLSLAGIVDGPVLDSGGDPASRVLVPGAPDRSKLHLRVTFRGARQMPPTVTTERDFAGEALLEQWIMQLAQPEEPSRLLNLAARAEVVTGGQAITTGFVLGPGAPKSVLIRAAGPTLAGEPFNVQGALPSPTLTVFGPNSSTNVAATNDDWRTAPNVAELRAASQRVGAFPLAENSRDASMLLSLGAGAYTVQAAARDDTRGITLVEVYDADPSFSLASSRLINLSIRARAGTGATILIPGLVVSAGAPKRILIRAIGPGLATFGIGDYLAAPVLGLYAGTERLLANTRWNTAPNAAEIRAAGQDVGAFALTEGAGDSALLASLSPGAYTLQVSGERDGTGVVLVEVYEVR